MQERIEPSQLIGRTDSQAAGSDLPIEFSRIVAGSRRQSRIILACAVVGVVFGFVANATAVPEYTATANLLIDSQKDSNSLTASIAELTFDTGAIDSQVEIIKSEKIARQVIDALKLTDDQGFMGFHGSLWARSLNALRLALNVSRWSGKSAAADDADVSATRTAIDRLRDNLAVRRVARTYVLSIQYTSPNRELAAKIANAFADAYLTEQLDAKFEATRRAADWLEKRISELKEQALESDSSVQRFKAEHGIVVTGGVRPGLISDQQISQVNEEMVSARADTARAQARYAQIEDLLKSGRTGAAVPDSLANPVINELRTKYLSASKTETQLESKLGPDHMQVLALKREMDEYDRLIHDELQRIAESYRSEAEVASTKEQSLALSMNGLVGQSAITNQTLVQLRELEREADTYRSLYQTFMQRYQEAIQQQSFPVTEARVITGAAPPRVPSAPNRAANLGLSLLGGLLVGASLGAMREHQDRVFRILSHARDDLGLELLGSLPIVPKASVAAPNAGDADPKRLRTTDPIQRYAIDNPFSSFAETLRCAKVSLDLAIGQRRPKIVGIISTLPNEGKSTVAKNFASLLAHLGASTLLIDADLRNMGLTKAVARHAKEGILEALKAERPLADYLLHEPESGLSVLPAVIRRNVPHSSEVISSAAMRGLIEKAGADHDYIVLDLPPLGPVVDVRAAASLIDAFIFVVEWGRTPRALAQAELTTDPAVLQKCVGVIYNKVNLKRVKLYEDYGSKDYYYGRYTKYYNSESV